MGDLRRVALALTRPASSISSVRHPWSWCISLLLCLSICSGGLDLLQLVAWTGMVVSRCQEGSLARSLRSTFDGRHPCTLCNAIARHRQDQTTPLAELMRLQGQLAKIAVLQDPVFFTTPAPARTRLPGSAWSWGGSGDELPPPTPPPQG
jgi:hypothetical protein